MEDKSKKTEDKSSKKKPEKKSDKENDKKGDKKADKGDRKSKFAGVEKGDTANKATAFAGLHFNAISTQKWLSSYYKKYKVEHKKKKADSDDKDKDNRVRILNAHFAMTATDEVICSSLVSAAHNNSKKQEAGLYVITEEGIINTVKLSKELDFTFGRFLDSYDTNSDYSPQLQLKKDEVTKFIETYGVRNTSIHLESGAFNFLMYIIFKNRVLLAESAYQLSQYAKKSSVDDRSILFSLRTTYCGNLLKTMFSKVDEVSSRVRGLQPDKGELDDSTPKKGSKDSKSLKGKKDKDKKKVGKGKKDADTTDESASESEDNASESESDKGSDKGSDSGSDVDSDSD